VPTAFQNKKEYWRNWVGCIGSGTIRYWSAVNEMELPAVAGMVSMKEPIWVWFGKRRFDRTSVGMRVLP
jgi:hypothetical protein